MNRTRFANYSKPIQAIIIVMTLFFLVFVAELGTLLTVFSLQYFGISSKDLFFEYKNKFHPLFAKRALKLSNDGILKTNNLQEYDPWFGYRNNTKIKKGTLSTDKLGFISNGDNLRDISDKPPGTYRIFILGGSTVAGFGLSSSSKSISAQLEDMLNASTASAGTLRHFQVINAGVIGWYSAPETAFAMFELLNYKPDMIISFDGINDREYSDGKAFNYKGEKVERYYWSGYQEYLKYVMEDSELSANMFRYALGSSKYNPAKYFYSLHFISYGAKKLTPSIRL